MHVRHGLNHLLIAIWLALLTGIAESAILLFQKHALGHLLFLSLHTVWLAPIAYVILFMIPAAPIVLAATVLGERIAMRVSLFVLGLFSVGSLILPFEQIHRAAGGLLALGAAFQLTRLLAPRADRVLRVARRTVAPLAVLIALVGLAMTLGARARERARVAGLPPAPSGAPDVLFIVLDAVRAENLGSYGYGRETSPRLDGVAREGAVFDWFLSTSPWSLPSHATMFTGTYPHEQTGGFMEPLDDRHPTIAEALARSGYATAGFSANLHYGSRDAGLGRGFIHYDDYAGPGESVLLHSWLGQTAVVRDLLRARSLSDLVSIARDPNFTTAYRRATRQRSAAHMTDAFLEWLPTVEGRPYFAFINYFDAHFPYRSHEGFGDWIAADSTSDPIDRYDSEIRFMDHHIGRLLDRIDEERDLDGTVVIVTSDHGEFFGERGLDLHGNSVYMKLLRVPLIVRYPPRVPRGTRYAPPTGMRHLARTVLDLARVEPRGIPGRSLVGLMTNPASPGHDEFVLSEFTSKIGPISSVLDGEEELRSLVTDELHYIRGPGGAEELYAYRVDPTEVDSLAHVEGYETTLDRFRAALGQWFPPPGDPPP